MKKLFTGMGEALWDIFPSGKQIGGAPANFAFHAGQLGFDSIAISAIGDDALGREIVEVFDEKGLRHLLPVVAEPTGTVRVTLDWNGVPDYEIVEGVAWDNIPIIPAMLETAALTSVFCFGTLAQRNPVSRKAIHYFLDNMPDGPGTLKVYDVNLRQRFYDRETVETSMAKSDILKLNDDEFAVLRDMLALPFEMEQAAAAIMDRYDMRTVIITCGAVGSYVFAGSDASYLDTPQVKVCDTVGAGDAFTAGFCSGIVAGLSLAEAHALAVDISAWVCTQPGAMPPLPAELKSRLSAE